VQANGGANNNIFRSHNSSGLCEAYDNDSSLCSGKYEK
jgi:hypothetical protein